MDLPTDSTTAAPITVALVNDYEIIVAGLAAMLAPYSDRVQVVELDVDREPERQADIALFDTFAGRRHALSRASSMVRDGNVDRVVLYTWDATAEFLAQAEQAGVSGVILKSVGGERLLQALERTAAGERLGMSHITRSPRSEQTSELSNREKEVLALLALGSTNRQIANELYLSVDTVKSHMRRLYSKLGVTNRTQAALRADQYQLRPTLTRVS
ncbi:MAG: DNA-binding response regulator [Ilumatobacteraceae bacterium]